MWIVECATYNRNSNSLYIFSPYPCDSFKEAYDFMCDEFDEEVNNIDVIDEACGNANARIETEDRVTTWAIRHV